MRKLTEQTSTKLDLLDRSKRALKRCEEIIDYYDPTGELSEYRFCKIHQNCLKSHGCGSL